MGWRHYAQRRHPHHEVLHVPGKPTVVFLTIARTDQSGFNLANEETHQLLRTIWLHATTWKVNRYVIMPDHLHVFVYPGVMDYALQRWQQYCKRLFQQHVSADVAVFQHDYWDTTIRSHAHYCEKWEYIRNNPVRKGFVANPDDWPYQGTLFDFSWIETK